MNKRTYMLCTAATVIFAAAVTLHLASRTWALACGGSVTITCPQGPAETVYYYDLVGSDHVCDLRIEYAPGSPDACRGTLEGLQLGSYRVVEGGQTRAVVELTYDAPTVQLDGTGWPVAPGR